MPDIWLIASGVVLVIAFSMPDKLRMRIGGLLAALLGLIGAVDTRAWIGAGVAGALLLVCAVPIGLRAVRRGMVRFSEDETGLRKGHFADLDAPAARQLIDQGHWLTARQGEYLTREGESVQSLFYLAEGEAQVLRDGAPVGRIGPGDLIGEAGVLDDAPATATVMLSRDCRLWFMLAPAMRNYVAVHPPVGLALRRSFAAALRGKLDESNRALAARGGE
jgi:hypothetical protein